VEYELPDPKLNPLGALVISYKTLKGIQFDDKTWDAVNWGRCSKSAKLLLNVCQGFDQAEKCLSSLASQFESANLYWTFETILKHSHEWIQKNGENSNGANARSRLFSEIANRRAKERSQGLGKPTSAGEIIAGIRNMPAIPTRTETNTRDSDYVDE